MQTSLIKIIVLGIIQGLTEFLPISSSGHLVIFQEILGITEQQLLLDIILHFGTVLALIVFFRKDILLILALLKDILHRLAQIRRYKISTDNEDKICDHLASFHLCPSVYSPLVIQRLIKLAKEAKLIGYILVVTAITGVIGILGKDFFESLFAAPQLVGFTLFVTGAILILTRKFMDGKRLLANFNIRDAILLGLVQAIAIIPGISRSGITISLMLFLGIKREDAFRFSFLVSIPAVLGALILEMGNLGNLPANQIAVLSIGFLVAFLSGFLALFILRKLIRKAKFSIFGYYCVLVSLAVWFLFILQFIGE